MIGRVVAVLAVASITSIYSGAVADLPRGTRISLTAGTDVYPARQSPRQPMTNEIGTIVRGGLWTITELDATFLAFERRHDGLIERITLPQSSFTLGGGADGRDTSSPTETATREDCAVRGRCNLALVKGARLDDDDPEHVMISIEAQQRVVLHRAVTACKRGTLVKITPPDDDWLAPATVTFPAPHGGIHVFADQIETLGDGKPVEPPACPARPRGGTYRMGTFALAKADAKAIASIADLKARYERAQALAKKSWLGERSFCEDPVRQVVDGTGTLAAAKQRHWRSIVRLHARMNDTYDEPGCERALRDHVESQAYAARHKLVLLTFGY